MRLGQTAKKATQAEKVALLTRHGILTGRVRAVLDVVRRSGNEAVHSHAADQWAYAVKLRRTASE